MELKHERITLSSLVRRALNPTCSILICFSREGGGLLAPGFLRSLYRRVQGSLRSLMFTLRLKYLVKLWWKHVKKPAWKSNVTKLKPCHKITASILNVKLKRKTWNPLENKFLRSQIIPSWGTFFKTKRRNLNWHADGENESLSVRVWAILTSVILKIRK